MTIEEAMAVIERGRLEPVYVLTGPNRYWAQAWLNAARREFLGENDKTSFVRLDGVTDFKAVQLELAAGGFFASRKIVVVENGRWSKKEEALGQYLSSPVADTLLVLVEDKASPSLEKLVGSHRFVELKPLSPVSYRRFVEAAAEERGVRFQKDGLEEFCRLTASNEYQAIHELEKMALTSSEAWTPELVREQVLTLPTDEPLWDVTDALLKKDVGRTIRLAQHHLGRGVPPLVLFIMMARQVIQIDRARRAEKAHVPLTTFQKEEGLRDFVAKKLWSAARQWSEEEVSRLLDWASRIDVAMKTGYGEADVWLILWIALLSRPRTAKRSL
ncbi:MAG: DNA polymerase III subunit delta [Firmicutes bacterium]|nr:DNA polymerase III subunit delta [Bacillota bacterium]